MLIDVSGTMGNYGPWQSPVRALVAGILGGQIDGSDWTLDGDANTAVDFRLEDGDRVHLFRFGSIQTDGYPYFAPALVLQRNEFSTHFPLSREQFREARTNKPLALAVGAQSVMHAGKARLIVVSDFLVDSDLSADQRSFSNQFESKTSSEPPVIYSWRTNPRVQVKLLRFSGLEGSDRAGSPVGPQVAEMPRLSIVGTQFFDSPNRLVVMRWKLTGDATDVTYSVSVSDPGKGVAVFVRKGLPSQTVAWPAPPSGQFAWRVTASLRDGTSISSSTVPLMIPGASFVPIMLGVGGLLALSLAVWKYFNTRSDSNHLPGTPAKDPAIWKR